MRFYKILVIFAAIQFLAGIIYFLISFIPNEQTFTELHLQNRLKLGLQRDCFKWEQWAHLVSELPSLPIEFVQRHQMYRMELNETCAPYPKLWKLNFHNKYWQTFYINDTAIFEIFGAYYDNRLYVTDGKPIVRILTLINQPNFCIETSTIYSQIWFDEHHWPLIKKIHKIDKLWDIESQPKESEPQWYPYLLSVEIKLMSPKYIPQTISLVKNECDLAANNFRIYYETTGDDADWFGYSANRIPRTFGVCVKGLDYPFVDMSARFIEWFELCRILGAEKFFIYVMGVHKNMTKVLNYYEERNLLKLTYVLPEQSDPHFMRFTHGNSSLTTWSYKFIHWNDCFYKNMYKYDYIVNLDIEEIIMPLSNIDSWLGIAELTQGFGYEKLINKFTLCFQSLYFPRHSESHFYSKEVPDYFYILQHVVRKPPNATKSTTPKCFFNTANTIAIAHNYIEHTSEKLNSKPKIISLNTAQLNQYAPQELQGWMNSKQSDVDDTSVWRFKDNLVDTVDWVLKRLNFIRAYMKINYLSLF